MTRKIAALETIFVYLSLAFLVFGFLRSRKNLSFWAVMYFSLSVILVYALSVPNLGSLYRARYGFWMLLVALGWGYMGRNEIWVTK
jgi:VanZ family protein